MKSTLAITTYVAASVDEVTERLRTADRDVPTGAEVEVSPVVDHTRIVVRVPWAPADEDERRTTSLEAGRLSTSLTELAAA